MAEMRVEKLVGSLPGSLTANTVYYVKNGNIIDVYVTNETATIVAYPVGRPTVEISQSAYDALTPPGPDTIYLITS